MSTLVGQQVLTSPRPASHARIAERMSTGGTPMTTTTDVLVVGAGPTGLLLAGDLAEQGISCTLVERREDESNLTRAFAVHARTLELLDMRGVADDLVSTGVRRATIRPIGQLVIDLGRLPSRFAYLLITPQYETERVLEERAAKVGVELRRGTELVGLRQDGDGVVADLRRAGATSTVRASYAVGTDGVGSAVRRALDLPFPGHTAVQSVMIADVRMSEPPSEVLTLANGRDGFAFIVPFGDGWYRVIAWDRHRQLPDDAPVTLDEVRDVTARVHGTSFGITEARWLSRFHSDERQAPHYRVGRVFLAGDAAHVHSPAGGLGMNAGLQDAADLGWRLVSAVRGRAALLDGYERERHPVGREVLRGSGALLRMVLGRNRRTRAASFLLGQVVGRVMRAPEAAVLSLSGIGITYPRPPGAHELVGRRAPDLPVAGGGRLYETLRGGRFVLVGSGGDERSDAVLAGHHDRVRVVTSTAAPARHALVRPDGYYAWASDDADPTALRSALDTWCGPAAGDVAPVSSHP
ncbi:MAG: FAD-dependent oxidoreductase [Streptosporangiales bacterium]|nr:FAD-dependent oxidoreductase [Streptosporangiales bacterium]